MTQDCRKTDAFFLILNAICAAILVAVMLSMLDLFGFLSRTSSCPSDFSYLCCKAAQDVRSFLGLVLGALIGWLLTRKPEEEVSNPSEPDDAWMLRMLGSPL
mmetsp:Transcript_34453/g.75203  ORF Transcript_34453/g.75203 Transcript_34453/m.75203 type:complete len:102 (+) Transcript_34453:103-408(+)